jgi:hypothetical protein
MGVLHSGTREITDTSSAKVEIGSHVLSVSNAVQALQRKLDALIDSVGNAQKGVLRSQIISPYSLMDEKCTCSSKRCFPIEQGLGL